jgi:hypothetical protein
MDTYAIVQDSMVVNLAIADSPLDDTWVIVDDPTIAVGWSYDSVNGFLPPLEDGGPYPPSSSLTFTPFNLSQASGGFPVSLSNGVMQIGCQYYNAYLAQAALEAILSGQVSQQGIYTAVPGGIQEGQFLITTADCELILNALQNAS